MHTIEKTISSHLNGVKKNKKAENYQFNCHTLPLQLIQKV